MRSLRSSAWFIAVLVAGLAACADYPITWTGPGPVAYDGPGTVDDLVAAHRRCQREVGAGVLGASASPYAEAAASQPPSCSAMAACMTRAGYQRAINGRLVLPASVVVPCYGG